MKLGISLMALVVACTFTIAMAPDDKPPIVNGKCPLSAKDVNEKCTSAVEVKFCCGNCKKKFDADPAKFIGKAGEKCPVSGKDVNPEKKSTVAVAFCCGNCKKKFDADPAKFLKKVKGKE